MKLMVKGAGHPDAFPVESSISLSSFNHTYPSEKITVRYNM
jgi:hypothetical protein